MRRHWKGLVLLVGAIAIAAFALFVVPGTEPEPSYKGRSLTDWVLDTSNREQQADALFQMRTNALPYLVKWACTNVPKWRRSVASFCVKHEKIVPHRLVDWTMRDPLRQVGVLDAFGLLRTNAYPALPALNHVATTRPDSVEAWRASLCLAAILYGYPNPAMPTLKGLEAAAYTNLNPIIREAATNAHRFAGTHGMQ